MKVGRAAASSSSLAAAPRRHPLHLRIAAGVLVPAAAANLLTAWFVSQERYIYFWDFTTYWTKYRASIDLALHDPILLVKNLIGSIWYEQYNNLAALGLLFWGLLFGPGRSAYILGIVNLYAIPALGLLFIVYRVLAGRSDTRPVSEVSLYVFACTVLLFAPFWSPILWGYLDVGGLILACAVLWIHFSKPVAAWSVTERVVVGVLLALMVLFRRWYSYWAVTFLVVAAAEQVIEGLRLFRGGHRGPWRGARNVLVGGLVSAGVLAVLAWPMVRTIIMTNYPELHTFWRSETLGGSLAALASRLGGIHITAFLIGAAVCLRDPATRRRAAFLFAQLLAILILFLRTQDFDAHHVYLLAPATLLPIVAMLERMFAKRRVGLGAALGTTYLLLAGLSSAMSFLPATGGLPWSAYVFGRRHWPLVRHDLPEVERLLATLWSKIESPSDKVYVLAGNELLNSDTLKKASMVLPVDEKLADHVHGTYNIYGYGPFPMHMFRARYLVVADPIQVLSIDFQKAVALPAEEILEGRGTGKSYRKLAYEFRLDGGVRVYLYERVAPVPEESISALVRRIEEAVPRRLHPFRREPKAATPRPRRASRRVCRHGSRGGRRFRRGRRDGRFSAAKDASGMEERKESPAPRCSLSATVTQEISKSFFTVVLSVTRVSPAT